MSGYTTGSDYHRAKMYPSCSHAVKICCAEKCYKNKSGVIPTLTGLNLNLPQGNIYAILGPSGCGKTTLLRCILGRLKLDKGTVMVFGHPPGSKESGIPGPNVGYMTQETTVYLWMTIGEYFWYYGTIFGLSSSQITSKTKYFIKLLKLPSKNTLANTLSGGQLRRMQFAAALIHEPKLLILDEPTVGVEVTTKQSMWEHLVKLTKENRTTVLLTTHYIEEARLADRVGMIHNCIMAAEDTTGELLRKYKESTLEGVFLKICSGEMVDVVVDNCGLANVENDLLIQRPESKSDGQGKLALEAGEDSRFDEQSRNGISTRKHNGGVAWHRLWPLMMKFFIALYRNPWSLVFLFLTPCLQTILILEAFNWPSSGIPMIMVNEDVGPFGEQYLTYLKTDIILQKHYQDYDVGLEAVRNGEAFGILHIKPNFSSVFQKRYADFGSANLQLLEAGTAKLQLDNTFLNFVKRTEMHMLESFQLFLYETLRSAGINPLVVQTPINISEEAAQLLVRPPRVYVLSGCLAQISYFGAISIIALYSFMERHAGYLEPNFIAGVTSLEIILSTFLVEAALIAVRNVCVILIALPLLNEFCKGSILLIYCLIYVQGLSGAAIGILSSVFIDQTFLLMGFVCGYLSVTAGTSGLYCPIETMPFYFRYFCQWLPLTQAGRAVEVIIHRGWDLRYFAVYSAFGISLLWMFIFLAISLWVLSHKK